MRKATFRAEQGKISDKATTLANLSRQVGTFVRSRDWEQFHSPKNLSMAIAIEAAELMDLFKWCSLETSRSLVQNRKVRNAVSDELADLLILQLAFCNSIELDLSQAVARKLSKIRSKYPVDLYKGKYTLD